MLVERSVAKGAGLRVVYACVLINKKDTPSVRSIKSCYCMNTKKTPGTSYLQRRCVGRVYYGVDDPTKDVSC